METLVLLVPVILAGAAWGFVQWHLKYGMKNRPVRRPSADEKPAVKQTPPAQFMGGYTFSGADFFALKSATDGKARVVSTRSRSPRQYIIQIDDDEPDVTEQRNLEFPSLRSETGHQEPSRVS